MENLASLLATDITLKPSKSAKTIKEVRSRLDSFAMPSIINKLDLYNKEIIIDDHLKSKLYPMISRKPSKPKIRLSNVMKSPLVRMRTLRQRRDSNEKVQLRRNSRIVLSPKSSCKKLQLNRNTDETVLKIKRRSFLCGDFSSLMDKIQNVKGMDNYLFQIHGIHKGDRIVN